jgi:hypothetical protein
MLLRRRSKMRIEDKVPADSGSSSSKRPYLDDKPELDTHERQMEHELSAEREPQEMEVDQDQRGIAQQERPPPVPFASKPGRFELPENDATKYELPCIDDHNGPTRPHEDSGPSNEAHVISNRASS